MKNIDNLRNIHMYKLYFQEKKGFPICNDKKVIIPNTFELLSKALNQIRKEGFKEIERVSPYKANCIVRVFGKSHFEYEHNEKHNLYGYYVFTKSNMKTWKSNSGSSRSESFELDFTKCEIRQWLYQDEYIDYDCDFADFYFRVS